MHNIMSLFKKNINKILYRWTFFISWILSLCGISVGNFGCAAYGPPDDLPQEQLNSLRKEVSDLEKRIDSLYKVKSNLIKSLDKRNIEINNLNSEKDSILILLKNNEK